MRSPKWIAARRLRRGERGIRTGRSRVGPGLRRGTTDATIRKCWPARVITTIDDEDLGPLKMQNVMFRMERHPRSDPISRGRRLGQDNRRVLSRRTRHLSRDQHAPTFTTEESYK